MQHDMYGKLAKNRQQGVSNAFKRLQVDKEGKPVHHLVTKEETVEEQLYKQGRFVTGAGKKPFKAPTLVSPRVDESRGHKVLSTFFKNREVAQRAYQGNPAHDSTVAAGGGTPADQGIAAAKRDAKKVVKESRKAEIVKEIMKKKKSDKFESEPELSNTQSKSDQTV
jgi:hypothetical protein